jgi:hypothetical protein
MCELEASHTIIYILISFLAIGVIFLILASLTQLKLSRDLALQVKYLEGSSDLIFQGQQQINKIMVAFIENAD